MAFSKSFKAQEAKEYAHKPIKNILLSSGETPHKLHKSGSKAHKSKKGKSKIEKVMHEFKEHALHSSSKKGPMVKSRKQAIAIALSEARKSGAKIHKKSK